MPDPKKDLVRLVVGEAPGETEAEEGRPFAGGAGRTLDMLLNKARIDRDGLTITNCIQCRPPDNVFPTDPEARKYISKEEANAAISQCMSSHVRPLLSGRPWTRVDLLGDKPLRIVAQRDGGVFKWRGSPLLLDVPSGGSDRRVPALATLHPAYLMRDQVYIPVVVNDLLKSLTPPKENYLPFPSLDDVRAFKSKRVCLDIETRGWSREIVCVGFSAEATKALCVPFRGPYIPEIKRIILGAEELIGHNICQFDIPILFTALGIEW